MKQHEILKRFKEKLESKRYAPNTVAGYLHSIKPFLKEFKDRDLSNITESELSQFFDQIKSDTKFTPSYQNHIIRSVENLYSLWLGRNYNFERVPKIKFIKGDLPPPTYIRRK